MANIRTDYSTVKFADNGKLKLLIIVGTRPEIIRLAAVINRCRKYFDTILAHTGQNYDYNLNGVFFRDLKLSEPDVYMDSVGEDLGETIGNIMNTSYKLRLRLNQMLFLYLVTPIHVSLLLGQNVCTFLSSTWKQATVAKMRTCPRKPIVEL